MTVAHSLLVKRQREDLATLGRELGLQVLFLKAAWADLVLYESRGERLRADEARRETLGLNRVPSSRRLGEYFARFGERDVEILLAIVRIIAAKVSPFVVEHLIATHGSAPVFIDGSAIEGDGNTSRAQRPGTTARSSFDPNPVFLDTEMWERGGPRR